MAETALLVSGRTRSGERDALYALYVEHVVPHIEQAAEVQSVVWSADREDADAYHLFEVFEDGADHRAVLESDWFRAYMKLAAPLAAEPPMVRLLDARWIKG